MTHLDLEYQRLDALRIIRSCLLELKWLAAATRFELAMHRHYRALKAGYNPDQPRDEFGRWTDAEQAAPASGPVAGSGSQRIRLADAGGLINPGVMSDVSPFPVASGSSDAQGDPAAPGNRSKAIPTDVVLPDGSTIPDSKSPSGNLRSPTADLSAVARAGRETGATFRMLLENSNDPSVALGFFVGSLRRDLAQGGTFDYQRDGTNSLPTYRHISNFNVGLYNQQAGLSLNDTLTIAGAYAKNFSNNPGPRDSYGLPEEQRRFMELGYRAGQSGVFDAPP